MTTFSLVVLFGAFILFPGGGGFFGIRGAHLAARSVPFSFAPLGASFLMPASEEVAFWALQLWFRTIFAEMTFLLAVEACVFTACLDGINVHGVRVLPAHPFRRSFLYEA